jgi:hypothetical protein
LITAQAIVIVVLPLPLIRNPKRMLLSMTQIDKQKKNVFVAVGTQSHTLNSANEHVKDSSNHGKRRDR